MSRGRWCCAIALGMLALLFPAAAFPAPPTNVKVTLTGNQISTTWDDPAVDGSNVPSAVEIAHGSNTAADGSFSDSAKIRAPLGASDTTYTSPPLPNGTYYVHVGAYQIGDPKCDVDRNTGDLVCPTDWSPTITVRIGPGPGPAIGDTVTGFKSLRVPGRQKAAKLLVEASIAEVGTIIIAGTVSVPNSARVFKIKPVSANAVAGKTVKVNVKLSKQALKAINRALKRHRKIRANLTITAQDAVGNKKTEKRSVKLK